MLWDFTIINSGFDLLLPGFDSSLRQCIQIYSLTGRGKHMRRRQLKNWFGIKVLSPFCLAASLFQQEGDYFFHNFGSSSEETEWNRVASRLCAWCRDMKRQNRRGKRPVENESAAFVSDVWVWAHRREFLLRGSPPPPPPCLLGYHPARGHDAAAFSFLLMLRAQADFPKSLNGTLVQGMNSMHTPRLMRGSANTWLHRAAPWARQSWRAFTQIRNGFSGWYSAEAVVRLWRVCPINSSRNKSWCEKPDR